MAVAEKQINALKLMKRPNGATVELLVTKLDLENTKQARGLIDRLREKGVKIKNVSHHTFKVSERRNPRTR